MNTIFRLYLFFAMVLVAFGADVKFSSLPTATSPSTNSFVPIIDLNLPVATQNEKYLLTNLATVAQLNSSTNSLTNSFVLKAGDTMTGSLTFTNSTPSFTNADLTLKEMRFRPTVGTLGSWTINSGTGATNNADGTYDETFNVAFNYPPNGGRYDTNLHAFKFGFESDWKLPNGTNVVEWNADMTTVDGTTYRAFSGIFNKKISDAKWGLAGSEVLFYGKQIGTLNPTVFTITTNANESTYAFNGFVSATTNISSGSLMEGQSNLWWRTTAFPYPSTNYERAVAYWNGTVFTIGTEANGSGSVRQLTTKVGTNAVQNFYTSGISGDSTLTTMTYGTLGGDVTLNTMSGELLLTAVGTNKRVVLSASSAGNSVDVGTGVLKISRASGILSLSANSANAYVTSGAATTTLLNIGRGAGGLPGSYLVSDDQGNTTFYGTNSTLVASLAPTGGLTLSGNVSIKGGVTKVCTSAVSNALFYVSVPNTNMIGGRVLYTVASTDGTDAQQITGTLQFGAVGKATAVTANVTDVQNTSTVSAGTLTATLTANVSTNNVFALMVTPTTSLTTTNLTVKWRLETPNTYTVNAL